MSKFIYLLNRMENAAQASDPSTAGYGLARREVLEYVEALEKRSTESLRADICHAPSSSGLWFTDGRRECYTCGAKCLPGERIHCRYGDLERTGRE